MKQIEVQPSRPFTPDALVVLQNYGWPGNVRELIIVVANAQVISDGESVQLNDLPDHLKGPVERPELFDMPYKEARQCCNSRFDRDYIHRALLNSGGNVTQAAIRSGIGRQYFQLRMSEQGLSAAQYRVKKEPEGLKLATS